MTKVRITDNGLIQESGTGLDVETTLTFTQGIKYTATALTTNKTLIDGGLYTLSASTDSALTITLPSAASVPGALFMFRALSTGSHVITASEAGGPRIIGLLSGTSTTGSAAGAFGFNLVVPRGGKITFPTAGGTSPSRQILTGSACTLLCDGASFIMLGSSGSMKISD